MSVATLVSRRRVDGSTAFKVQWRLGGRRDGGWQSETFDERKPALNFQALVEAHGHTWPEGWVKGWGFRTVPDAVTQTAHASLIDFGQAYVRRLTSVGPDTQTRYLSQVVIIADWITEATGKVPTVQGFVSDDDRAWINARRRAGASPKTIANYHGLLSAIFKDAVQKGTVGRNPCEGVKLPAVDDDTETDEHKTLLSEDDFALLRECVDPDSRELLTVAVGTGLRWGELTALRLEDLRLDATSPHLIVRRAWKRNGKGEFALEGEGRFYLGTPKTKESRRKVTLAPPVVQALRRACRGKGQEDLVFASLRGNRLDQGNWYESRWQVAVRAARLRGLGCTPRFHDIVTLMRPGSSPPACRCR
jgi:integrase